MCWERAGRTTFPGLGTLMRWRACLLHCSVGSRWKKLNDVFVPNSVYLLYGGKHGTHGVPDSVWKDSCQHLLRTPPPSQLVHVQPERSPNHFQSFSNRRRSQVKIRNKIRPLFLPECHHFLVFEQVKGCDDLSGSLAFSVPQRAHVAH